MLRKLQRYLKVSAFAALVFALGACVEPLDPSQKPGFDPNGVSFPIRLHIPGGLPVTKASAGGVEGMAPESQVYGVQVWMFDHHPADVTEGDTETAISYTEVTDIWTTSGERPSGYYIPSAAYWNGDDIYEILLWIPGYIIDRPADKLKFDFYILANGPSVGNPASRDLTRGELKTLTFGKGATADYFGTTNPKSGLTPLDALGSGGPGLPISGFFNRVRNPDGTTGGATGVDLSFLKPEIYSSLTDDDLKARMPVVQLKRAVSKIRFVFAAPSGAVPGAKITSISVDGSLIPETTYVFPRENDSGAGIVLPSAEYDITAAPVVAPASIGYILDPNYLRSSCDSSFTITIGGTSTTYEKPKQMSAKQYDSFLTAAVEAGLATQTFVYLRESDKPIKGIITYSLDGGATTRDAVFDMERITDYNAATTNFHRNHAWTVYAYFDVSGLYIKPVVSPWEDGASYVYAQCGSAVATIPTNKQSLFGYGWTTSNDNPWWQTHKDDDPAAATEWYFRRQDEGYIGAWSGDWLHSQIVTAPGLNPGGAPVHANRIELRTNGFNVPLKLKLDNTDDFHILTYNNATAEFVNWIEGGEQMAAGWTEADGVTIPSSVSNGGTTYFYVVPKEGPLHEGKKAVAYLVTAPTDGSGSQKLPFNAGVFPGSNENTEINFYSVSADTFKSYYTSSRPENIKAYDKTSEVTI